MRHAMSTFGLSTMPIRIAGRIIALIIPSI
jgi:hypothetical protein